MKSTSKAVLDHPDHFLLIINDEYFLSHGHARYCWNLVLPLHFRPGELQRCQILSGFLL